MKTIEATISLLVFLSFSSFALIHLPQGHSSLYEYELANDIWRVLYLRGYFHPSDEAPNFMQDEYALLADTNHITDITGLCISFETELEGGTCLPGERTIYLKKTVFIKGTPRSVELHIGAP